MKKNSLTHSERIKSPKHIEKIFSKMAHTITEEAVAVRYFIETPSDYPLQAGFSVSKRLYKKAHDRNLYKRWLRESYRIQKWDLMQQIIAKNKSCYVFFILHKRIDSMKYHELQDIMTRLLGKLKSKIERIETKAV